MMNIDCSKWPSQHGEYYVQYLHMSHKYGSSSHTLSLLQLSIGCITTTHSTVMCVRYLVYEFSLGYNVQYLVYEFFQTIMNSPLNKVMDAGGHAMGCSKCQTYQAAVMVR